MPQSLGMKRAGSTPKKSTSKQTPSSKKLWPIALEMWVVAAVIGLVVGGAVIALRNVIMGAEWLFYRAEHENLSTAASSLSHYHLIMAPVVGGCIVGLLLWVGSNIGMGKNPRAFGVADVIKARRFPRRIEKTGLNFKEGLLSVAISAISLGSGASTGREGPAVHLGAMLARAGTMWLNLDMRNVRTLIGCGAAAAVSASFHAPLAGVLFAREIILQRYRLVDIGPVSVASVVAALLARDHFGNDPIFVATIIENPDTVLFLGTPVMGLLAAGLAMIMIWLWSKAPDTGEQFAQIVKLPIWALPPLGGLAMGFLALAFPQVLGVGYESTAAALAGSYGAAFMLVLVFAKLAATAICLGARFGSGVFSPSIYMGAMLGGAFGALYGWITGDTETGMAFYTIVGMGAVSGAVLGAPVSTTLIVFELTSSYETAAACLISVSLATVLIQSRGGGIFERQVKLRMRQSY
ncbi:chloride channel protein [Hirschia maritima]|uniref:chloride channel protein n=1 Tax=Hirschia maritima TaxID=1121961 RepID=UPI0003703016|nr:chloride channel protein [Hirschia maritima]